MTTKTKLLMTAALAATALSGTQLIAGGHSTSIATVVKIAGIQWFNRMEEGVNKFRIEPVLQKSGKSSCTYVSVGFS